MSDEKTLRFFLGANTPQGFVSRFDHLAEKADGWRTLIIKGGPGSGKSTLMKRLAESLGGELELIHCSSDADCLDGVVCPAKKFAIADGTAPHVMEPRYPGAADSLVDVTACWDVDKLFAHRGEIMRLTDICSKYHEHCCRFMSAAASLLGDTYRIALEAVDIPKLSAYCARLGERELKPQDKTGAEKVRFLSAVTNKGVVMFPDTAKKLCDRVYLVCDEYGAVSRLILNSMRRKALSAGYDVISCYCPMSPFEKLEHLFIPELRLGFMTSNRYHEFAQHIDPYRIVNSQRFTGQEKLKPGKKRISVNRKAAAQMVVQAERLIRDSKAQHDELEKYYTAAMDFDKLERLTGDLIQKIKKF